MRLSCSLSRRDWFDISSHTLGWTTCLVWFEFTHGNQCTLSDFTRFYWNNSLIYKTAESVLFLLQFSGIECCMDQLWKLCRNISIVFHWCPDLWTINKAIQVCHKRHTKNTSIVFFSARGLFVQIYPCVPDTGACNINSLWDQFPADSCGVCVRFEL